MASILGDKRFWLTSGERSLMTLGQTMAAELAVFSTVEIREKGLEGLPWTAMISVAVVAALVSLCTSIGKGTAGKVGAQVVLRPKPELQAAESVETTTGQAKAADGKN